MEKHHEVLPAWVQSCRHHNAALPLITFDHHTDLHECFRGSSEATRKARIESIDITDSASIEEAVHDLRNDQHIDCAHQLRIVSDVYVFLSHNIETTERSYATLFNFDPCAPGCQEEIHYDCEKKRADVVIDDSLLESRVAIIEASLNLETDTYILDIDLDIFNTKAAISPKQSTVFQRLIQHADIITIARESSCVKTCRLEGEEDLTADYLEKMLFKHIQAV